MKQTDKATVWEIYSNIFIQPHELMHASSACAHTFLMERNHTATWVGMNSKTSIICKKSKNNQKCLRPNMLKKLNILTIKKNQIMCCINPSVKTVLQRNRWGCPLNHPPNHSDIFYEGSSSVWPSFFPTQWGVGSLFCFPFSKPMVT